MGMIRQGFTDFQQELPVFSIVFYANIDPCQFSQIKIFVIVKMKPQLLYTIR